MAEKKSEFWVVLRLENCGMHDWQSLKFALKNNFTSSLSVNDDDAEWISVSVRKGPRHGTLVYELMSM